MLSSACPNFVRPNFSTNQAPALRTELSSAPVFLSNLVTLPGRREYHCANRGEITESIFRCWDGTGEMIIKIEIQTLEADGLLFAHNHEMIQSFHHI